MGRIGSGHKRAATARIRRPGGGHARRDDERADSGRRRDQPMSEHQIVGFLGRKIWQAMNDEDGDLSSVRQKNFNYYIGELYGNEREGYSQFVTREVLETVEWVLPSILRVFLGGDRLVVFDPVEPMDEKEAAQETDIVNYYVMRANNRGYGGFLPLHHWFKDVLMFPNGYLKVNMEEYDKTEVGTFTGLTDIGVQMVVDNPEAEILEQRSKITYIEGNPEPVEVFDLKVKTTKRVKELRVDAVPPEECLVDNDCVTLNLDEADFVCHRVRKTYSALIREGYSQEELDKVGLGEDYQWNDERTNRLFYEDEDPDAEDEDDPSMRTFWVHDCTAFFDYDGDGVAEQRHVVLIGDKVFLNEETNYQPLIAMSSILMPHKHNGMSFIDIVRDLQLLSSVLTRQMLDNIYKQNIQKKFFSEDALLEDGSTMEALINTQAEFVPVRGPAQAVVASDQHASIINEILPVLQNVAAQREVRTGVTPQAALDANTLQEVRQDVFSNALERASQRVEMLVRIFAETGFRQLMLKVHQLLRSHWDVERAIKLRGEWVDVDPQAWRDRTEVSVNTGLGFNSKQLQLQLLTQLLEIQREAAGQGLASLPTVYNTLEKWITAAGVGNVKSFFVDPESPEFQPPEPPPDPNLILAEAQAQALTQEQERKAAELQVKAQQDGQKMQVDMAKGQSDVQLKQIDQQIKLRELALKEIEMEREGRLQEGELAEKINNLKADTQLKQAQADNQMADAASKAVEASDTYQQALKVVAEGAEANEGAIGDGNNSSGADNAKEKEE